MQHNYSYKEMLDSPYKGLMPYYEEDVLFFFGRTDWREIIIDNLMGSRLTVLYGASGVGKSSVLRAGVAHHLRQFAEQDSKAYRMAVVVFSSWSSLSGDDLLLDRLKDQIKKEITKSFPDIKTSDPELSLTETLKAWTENLDSEEESGQLFIILDQFEDYLRQSSQEEEVETFASEFCRVVNYPYLAVNFLISIREDWLAKLDRFKGSIPQLFSNRLELKPLDEQSAREAIVGPIDEYNRQQVILDNLRASRLTVLCGDRGVGKTLVLKDGIAPRLRKFAKQNLKEYGIPEFAVVVFNSWRNNPLDKLKKQIKADIKNIFSELPKTSKPPVPVPEFTFTDTLKVWTEFLGGKEKSGQLFIILDQFEDYLKNNLQEEGDKAFANEFCSVVNHPELAVNFLISIREESLPELKHFQESISNWPNQKQYLYLSHRGIEPFEEKVSIQLGLDAEILKLLKEENSHFIDTSILQLVMHRLWEEELRANSLCLQLKTLKKLLGKGSDLNQIFNEHVKKVMESPPLEDLQEIAIKVFEKLVTEYGTKIAYPVRELASLPEIDQTQLDNLLHALVSDPQRLLHSVGRPATPERQLYEISHDRLALAILGWYQQNKVDQKLKEAERTKQEAKKIAEKWTEDARQEVKQAKQLAKKAEEQASQAEERANRFEEQAEQLKRTVRSMSIGAIAIVITGVGWMVWTSYLSFKSRLSRIEGAVSQFEQAKEDFQSGESGQIEALSRAMKLRNELPEALKEFNSIPFVNTKQYTSKAKNSLQTILKGIKEKNQHQVNSPVLNVHFSPDGKNLAIVATDSVRLWNQESNKQPSELEGYKGNFATASFNSDGNTLTTLSKDGTIHLFNLQDNQLKEISDVEDLPIGEVSSVSFNSKRKTLATGSPDGTVQLWNLQDKQPTEFKGHQGSVWNVSFSPDGQQLATGSADGIARLWNLQGELITEFKGHNGDVLSISFDPNGQYLATGSADGTARLWNLQGELITEFKGQQDDQGQQGVVLSVSFSPDGQQLATGSADGTVRLWNLQDKQFVELKGHQNSVLSVSFDSDGKTLATGSTDGTIFLWDLQEKPSPDDESLDELLNRGCDWLEDYIATHPKKQEELLGCSEPTRNNQ